MLDELLSPAEANAGVSFSLSVSDLKGADKGQTVHFAMVARDEANNTSPISNVARVVIVQHSEGLRGGDIAGIIIGSVLAIFLLMVTIYFLATKSGCCCASEDDSSYDLGDAATVSEMRRKDSAASSRSRRDSGAEMKDVTIED